MYKIKLIQDNPIVGDIKGNFDLAVKHITQAISEKTDLVIFSEMFLTGYPPEDLLLREDFIKDSEEYLKKITKLSDKISIIIGSPIKESDEIFNSAVFLSAGKLSSIYKKKKLHSLQFLILYKTQETLVLVLDQLMLRVLIY